LLVSRIEPSRSRYPRDGYPLAIQIDSLRDAATRNSECPHWRIFYPTDGQEVA
jgi:hypothetical protein